MERDYTINQNVARIIEDNDKKPTAIADKAGIRRDTFSRIIRSRRPIYADELMPIVRALGVPLSEVVCGAEKG